MSGSILAIDAGTTGVTAVVVSDSGDIVAKGYQEFAQHFAKPGWVEHAPEEIWQCWQAMPEAEITDTQAPTGPETIGDEVSQSTRATTSESQPRDRERIDRDDEQIRVALAAVDELQRQYKAQGDQFARGVG